MAERERLENTKCIAAPDLYAALQASQTLLRNFELYFRSGGTEIAGLAKQIAANEAALRKAVGDE